MIARRLRIAGRVQGVSYRAWAVAAARELGLSGWVRNRADGTVEALAIGDEDAVDTFVARCHEGPAAAAVDSVGVGEAEMEPVTGFGQRPTL